MTNEPTGKPVAGNEGSASAQDAAPATRGLPNSIRDPRYFPRANVSLSASARLEDRQEETWRLVNVSEGGASLCVDRLPPSGARVEIAFTLPGESRVAAVATVVWAESRPTGDVGIQFAEISEESLVAIRAFVETHEPMAWDQSSELPREIAVRFVPLVRRQAYALSRRTGGRFAPEDLVGVGFLALVEANARFDSTLGVPFEAFALIRIRGAMLDELRRVDPLSRSARRFKRSLDGATARLSSRFRRQPSEQELAAELEMTLDDYRASLDAVGVDTVELDGGSTADGESAPSLQLADASASPEDDAVESQSAQRVERAVQALPPRLREVLDMYFGENRTMRDIGTVLGVTEARISQLVSQAIGRVREQVADPLDANEPNRGRAGAATGRRRAVPTSTKR